MKTSVRFRWVLVLVAVLAFIIVTAFLVGRFVTSPNDQAIDNSKMEPIVTALVETRTFPPQETSLPGIISTGSMAVVGAEGGEDPRVVTSVNVTAGSTIESGSVIGRVSGRPVIALSLPFVLYRDIAPGDVGDDVAEIQRALQSLGLYPGAIDGVYGSISETAMKKLYAQRGLEPPVIDVDSTEFLETNAGDGDDEASGEPTPRTGTPVKRAEIFALPDATGIVESISPVGTVLDAETSFAVLRTGTTKVTVRVPSSLKEVFTKDTATSVLVDGEQTPGIVERVSEFRQTGSEQYNSTPGYDVDIALTDAPEVVDGDIATVTVTGGEESVSGLAVPITALRGSDAAMYVVRENNGENISVNVETIADGWALVSSSQLREGDRVVISVAP